MTNSDDLAYLEQTDSYYRTIKRGCIFNEDFLSTDDKNSECIKYCFGNENEEGEYGSIIILENNFNDKDIVETSKRWKCPPALCNIYTCKHLFQMNSPHVLLINQKIQNIPLQDQN